MNTNFLLIVPYWYGSFCIINNLFKKPPSDWRFFFIKSSEIFRISMYVCVMTNRWCVCLILLWRGQKNWKECHRPLNQYTTYRLYSVKDVLKWKTTSQLFKTLTKYSWHVHNYCYIYPCRFCFFIKKSKFDTVTNSWCFSCAHSLVPKGMMCCDIDASS